MQKCEKCAQETEGYKCDMCGAEAEEHDAEHECGGEHCMPKCSGCGEAEAKCACAMSLFMGLHSTGSAGREQLEQAWNTYKKACDESGLKAKKVYYSKEKGVAYCITEAPSEAAVRDAHKSADIPLDDVYEVGVLK